jgi:hypothetical protein
MKDTNIPQNDYKRARTDNDNVKSITRDQGKNPSRIGSAGGYKDD